MQSLKLQDQVNGLIVVLSPIPINPKRGVKHETLCRYGAVSEQTASEMVLGALSRSTATVAVAVTGIAGPGGAVPGKPVGTVYLAWCKKGKIPVVKRHQFSGDRNAVRESTIKTALEGLCHLIEKN